MSEVMAVTVTGVFWLVFSVAAVIRGAAKRTGVL